MPSSENRSRGTSWLPFVLLSLVFHLVYTTSIFLIYFTSPVVHPSRRFSASTALQADDAVENPSGNPDQLIERPADRLVLIVGDGLRADTVFKLHQPHQLPAWSQRDLLSGSPASEYLYPQALSYAKNGSSTSFNASQSENFVSVAPYLRRMAVEEGAWGISHTRVPTESRPGHVAMIAGMYEDVSAVTKGWKSNPMPFDSTLNQSTHAFAFGSPDIVPMFVKGAPSGHVDQFCYAEEEEDFTKDATHLDLWVLDRLRELFAKAKVDSQLMSAMQKPGVVFFLHLLGPDTTGHTFRPHSPEYLGNAVVVDAIVREVQRMFEEFFGETDLDVSKKHRTAYVFTADHGMSKLGNHGDGETDNTRTPLIAWGAGVRKPVAVTDSQRTQRLQERLEDEYFNHWGQEMEDSLRQDLAQADITPLMASLLGLSIPANSEGQLPLSYLSSDVSERSQASALLANARQVLEMYRVKDEQRSRKMLRYVPYSSLPSNGTTLPGSIRVSEIIKQIQLGRYSWAESLSEELIKDALDGLQYLQTYDWLLLVSIVTVGYLGSIAFGAVFLLRTYILTPQEIAAFRGQKAVTSTSVTPLSANVGYGSIFGGAIMSVMSAKFIAESSPAGYYVYLGFSVFFWSRVLDEHQILLGLLRRMSSTSTQQRGILKSSVGLILAVVSLELMVVGYLERVAWTAGFLVIGLIWPSVTFDLDFRTKHEGTLLAWGLTCLATSMFTLGTTDKEESILILIISGVVAFALGATVLYFPSLFLGNDKLNVRRRRTINVIRFELVATALSTVITSSSAKSLQLKKGLPPLNQVAGWAVLAFCLTIPFIYGFKSPPKTKKPTAQSETGLVDRFESSRRLIVLVLAFPPIFVLLSIRDETLFFISYTLTLIAWTRLELALDSDRDEVEQATTATLNKRRIGSSHFRISLFYLFFLHVGFFGTGNVASISSFYLSPVYRLVPIFNPFLMATLLLLKILVPFLILASIFHTLCTAPTPPPPPPPPSSSTTSPPQTVGLMTNGLGLQDAIAPVLLACISTDVLALSFLFAVRTDGSWLEIGRTITHFVMANMLQVFMLALAIISAAIM